MRLTLPASLSQIKRRSLIGQLVAVLIAVQVMVWSGFLAFRLPVPTSNNLKAAAQALAVETVGQMPPAWQDYLTARLPFLNESPAAVRFSLYVPQAPIAVFIGYVLGWELGLIAASFYVIVGVWGACLGIYVFAGGGGPTYYLQPGFGYILGMIAASALSGWITVKRRTSFRQLISCLAALAALHLTGLIYLFGIAFFSALASPAHQGVAWQGWLLEEARNLTWYTLAYDFLFALSLVGIGFPFRWLVSTLTAPDIAARGRGQNRLEELLDEQSV